MTKDEAAAKLSESVALTLIRPSDHGRGDAWEKAALRAAVAQVCELIGNGMTKLEACEAVGLSPRTYVRACNEDDECWRMHARARLDQTHALADEALRFARTPSRSLVEAQDKRTYLDTVKWLCAKVHPRAYGDPRQLEITGADADNVQRQQWQIGERVVSF